MAFWKGVYALLYRNVLAKLRHPLGTFIEILVPCLFLILCIIVKETSSVTVNPEYRYASNETFDRCLQASYGSPLHVGWGTFGSTLGSVCQWHNYSDHVLAESLPLHFDNQTIDHFRSVYNSTNYYPLFALRERDYSFRPLLLADQIGGRDEANLTRIPLLVTASGEGAAKNLTETMAKQFVSFANHFMAKTAPPSFGLAVRCDRSSFRDECTNNLTAEGSQWVSFPPTAEYTEETDSRLTTKSAEAPPVVGITFQNDSDSFRVRIRTFYSKTRDTVFTAPLSTSKIGSLLDGHAIRFRPQLPYSYAGPSPSGAQLLGFTDIATFIESFYPELYNVTDNGRKDGIPMSADQSAAVRSILALFRLAPIGLGQAVMAIETNQTSGKYRSPYSVDRVLQIVCAICNTAAPIEGFGTAETTLCNETRNMLATFAADSDALTAVWDDTLLVSKNVSDEMWIHLCPENVINSELVPLIISNFTTSVKNGVNVTISEKNSELAFVVPMIQFLLDYLKSVLTSAAPPLQPAAKISSVLESGMPLPKSTQLSGSDNLLGMGIYGEIWFCVYLFPLSKVVRSLMVDKSLRLREIFNIYGSSNLQYWCSLYLFYFIYFLAIAGFTALASIWALPGVAVLAPALLGLLYSFSGLSFMILMTSILNNPRTAGFISIIALVVLLIPYLGVYPLNQSFRLGKLLSCLASPTALCWGSDIMLAYDVENVGDELRGFQLSDWNTPFRGVRFWEVLLMLVADTFIYAALGLYIYAVHPGEFGVPQQPWFIISPAYWCPSRFGRQKKRKMRKMLSHRPIAELLMEDSMDRNVMEPVIEVKDVHRVFTTHITGVGDIGKAIWLSLKSFFSKDSGTTFIPWKARGVHAVKGVSFTVNQGEIFCLLGHNGAGKTTTISMLTGLTPVSAGTATICGFDISENCAEARKHIGYCPQFDLLFEGLTVYEHLKMVGLVKGMSHRHIWTESNSLLESLELKEKESTLANDLSGGQKRRVSLGMALMGNAKAIFLDEPTTGLDPATRRALWITLKEVKKSRAIILTTHFMDEADYLGDRIGIMADGTLRCMGSPMFLKSRLGVGYTLTCSKSPGITPQQEAQLISTTLRICSNASLRSSIALEIAFKIPLDASGDLARLLNALDTEGESLGVQSFSISITTLEEVFLKVAYYEETPMKEVTEEKTDQVLVPVEERDKDKEKFRPAPSMEGKKWTEKLEILKDEELVIVSKSPRNLLSISVTTPTGSPMKASLSSEFAAAGKQPTVKIVDEPHHSSELHDRLTDGVNNPNQETKDSQATQEQPAVNAPKKTVSIFEDTEEESISAMPRSSPVVSTTRSVSRGVLRVFGLRKEKSQAEKDANLAEQPIQPEGAVEGVSEKVQLLKPAGVLQVANPAGDSGDIFSNSMTHVLERTKWNIVRRHGYALTVKQWHCLRRDGMGLVCQIVLPVLLIVLLTQMVNSMLSLSSSPSSITFDQIQSVAQSDNIYPQTIWVGGPKSQDLADLLHDCTTVSSSGGNVRVKKVSSNSLAEFEDKLSDSVANDYPGKLVSYYSEADPQDANKLQIVAFHNSSLSPDAYMLSLYTLSKCQFEDFLKRDKGLSLTKPIELDNYPLPREDTWKQLFRNSMTVMWICLGLSLIPATWGGAVSRERLSGAQNSQYLAGVSVFVYWVTVLIFDMLFYLVPGGLIMMSLWLMGSTIVSGNVVKYFILGFFGFGIASGPFAFIVCFAIPGKPVMVQITVTFIGAICSALVPIMRGLPTYYIWKYFLFVLPAASLAELLCVIGTDAPADPHADLMSAPYCLGPVVFLYLSAPVYFVLVLILDAKYFNVTRNRIRSLLWPEKSAPKKISDKEKSSNEDLTTDSSLNSSSFQYPPLLRKEDSDVERMRLMIQNRQTPVRNKEGSISAAKLVSDKAVGETDSNGRTDSTDQLSEPPLLTVEGLNKTYPAVDNKVCFIPCGTAQPEKVAVRNLWLAIPKNHCFGFLGANGAGKTTTVSMLVTAIAPTHGTAILDGFNLAENADAVRERVGLCPQFDTHLDRMTAKEHLEMYARIALMDEKYIKKTFVPECLKVLGLEEYKDRITVNYSGGNKRKLSIGIAFIGDPKLVILDEPSSGVDPASRRKLWSLISYSMANSNRALMLTTHSMEECEALCHSLGIMKRGELICFGTPAHLREKFGEGYEVHVTFTLPDIAELEKQPEPKRRSARALFSKFRERRQSRKSDKEGDVETVKYVKEQSGGITRRSSSALVVKLSSITGGDYDTEFDGSTISPLMEILASKMDDFIDELANWFPGSQIVESVGSHCRVNVPRTPDSKLSQLFAKLESMKTAYGLVSYAVSDASLDAIFVRLMQDEPTAEPVESTGHLVNAAETTEGGIDKLQREDDLLQKEESANPP